MQRWFVLILLLIISSSAFAGQAEDCQEATRLVIEAYDSGQTPAQFPEQKRLLQQVLQLCPDHPEAHNNFASILEVYR